MSLPPRRTALVARRTVPRALRRALRTCLLVAAALCALAPAARAETGVGARAHATARAPLGVTITAMNDTALTLDSNKPALSGPNTMYAHFRVTNTSGTTLQRLSATLGGTTAAIFLGSGQDATQYLPTLAPGASADVYWFLEYSRVIGNRATLVVTVSDGAGNSATGSRVVATTGMISSQAGGNLTSQTLTATYLGMITYIDVEYSFGGANAGDTWNFQPAGTNALNAGCFQLTGSQVISSTASTIPVGTTNQEFFEPAASVTGSGYVVMMRWYFRVQCLGVTSTVKPYANQESGTKLKYSGNFDTWGSGTPSTITFPAVVNPITVAKSAAPDSLTDGGTATYTITLTNSVTSGSAVVDSIVDALPAAPAAVRFDSLASTSDVTAANSAAVPSAGATGTIAFRSVPGSYYTVPAGGSIRLVFKATIPTPEGTYVNTATGWVAKTSAGSATAPVVVRRKSDLVVAKSGSDSARVRDTVSYVLRTTNLGPSAADTVLVRDTLPATLTFVRGSRGATAAGGVVSFPFHLRLPKDSTLSDTVFAVASDTGVVVNRAAASSHSLDPVLANGDGSAAASRKTTTLRRELITVTVTPDGLATASRRLPGTRYAETFTVTNTGRYANSFDLLLAAQGSTPFLTRDSLQLPSGARVVTDSVRLSLASNVAQTLTVFYTVALGDSAQNVFRLRARAASDTTASDTGWVQVRRVRPDLRLAKSADAATVAPGADVVYTIAFSNAGEDVAANAVVMDDIPTAIQFKVGSAQYALPAAATGTLGYSKDGGATWTYTPVSGGCGAPAGYDACVNRVRLSLGTSLPAGAALSTGSLSFTARVR